MNKKKYLNTKFNRLGNCQKKYLFLTNAKNRAIKKSI